MMIQGIFQSKKMFVPILDCVWVEDWERRAEYFKGDMVQTVFADGLPRNYGKEQNDEQKDPAGGSLILSRPSPAPT